MHQILSNMISNSIYNNLQHFDSDINVQVNKWYTKTRQIQRTRSIRKSQNIQIKKEQISSPSKSFHGAPFAYFSGTCESTSFYNNLISKRSFKIYSNAIFLRINSRFNF